MKIKIGTTVYKNFPIEQIPIGILSELHELHNTTVKQMAEALKPLYSMQSKLQKNPSQELATALFQDFISDPEALKAFMLYIWAIRRANGDEITLKESSTFDFSQISYISEESDGIQAPSVDPLRPRPGSGRGDVKAPLDHKKRSRSKKSKHRSTKTSPPSEKSHQA